MASDSNDCLLQSCCEKRNQGRVSNCIGDQKLFNNRTSEHAIMSSGWPKTPSPELTLLFKLQVDEEFVKLWRATAVDAMDDAKIEEYLEKQGIKSMQDHGQKKPIAPKRKKAAQKRRQFKKPRDNDHLADVLETYEDNTLTQKGVPIK